MLSSCPPLHPILSSSSTGEVLFILTHLEPPPSSFSPLLTSFFPPCSSGIFFTLYFIYFSHGWLNQISHSLLCHCLVLLLLPLLLFLFVLLSASVILNATSKTHTESSQQSISSSLATLRSCVVVCVPLNEKTIHREIVLSCLSYMPGRFIISLLIVIITVRVCVCVFE